MKIISILVAAIALFQGLEILGGLIRRKDVPKRERIKKILIFLFLCIICACSYVLSDDEASENNQSTQDDTAIVSINDDNLSNLQNSSDSTSSESVETTVEPAEPTASIASPTPTDLPSEDSADTSNPNPLPTDNLDENSADADDSNPSLFANCYVDYTPEGVSSQVGFDYWDDELTDMQGQNHEGNLHLFIGDLFNMIQTTGDSMITATVHCIVNPECDLSRPLRLLGRFVVGSDTMGSDAY